MTDSMQLWAILLQFFATIVTIVIVLIKVRASTQAAIATVGTETQIIQSTIGSLQSEIKELRETIHELHLLLARKSGYDEQMERRISNLEAEVSRLRTE